MDKYMKDHEASQLLLPWMPYKQLRQTLGYSAMPLYANHDNSAELGG